MSKFQIIDWKLQDKICNLKVTEKGERQHTVTIEPCQDSFVQYGAPDEVLDFTLPVAEKLVSNNFKSLED
jgi:hypothetical protein